MDPHKETLRVLLVENSEDGYHLVRNLLDEAPRSRFDLDWARNYEVALREFELKRHDAYLVNYQLEERNGLDVLQEAIERGCRAPLVLLTGKPEHDIDIAAVRAGASDYLIKSEITPHLLERSIRYAIERKRVEETLRDSQHQLRHLSAELLHFQEEERKFIAGELHGNLGQLLVAVKLGVENTLAHLKQSRYSSQRLEPLVPVLQHAIEEVRQLYTRLRPIILDDLGVVAALNWYCREFTQLHPEVALSTSIQVEEGDIPERLKVVIYRLVQDALDISLDCGTRKEVNISLRYEDKALCLVIEEKTQRDRLEFPLAACTRQPLLRMSAMKERTIVSNGCFMEQWDETKRTQTIRVTWSLK
jgi:signal transduction histidine kinase